MIQGQLDLGPIGLVIEFMITVIVIAAGSWLLFRKRSSVFWKQTDYAYLIFTIIGGIVAASDLSISNWSKELQQNKIIIDEESSHLRDYVAVGINECSIRKAQRDADNAAASAERDDHIMGVIRPPPNIEPLATFKEKYDINGIKRYDGIKILGVFSPQFVDLKESDCTFLQRVSDAITSNSLSFMAAEAQSYQMGGKSTDAMEFIASDIEEINNYSDRADELETSLSSLEYLSLLKGYVAYATWARCRNPSCQNAFRRQNGETRAAPESGCKS